MSSSTGQPSLNPRPAAPPPGAEPTPPPVEPEESRRGPSRASLMVGAVVVGALVVTTAVLAVLSTTDEEPRSPAVEHNVSGARDGRSEAQFEIVSGADRVSVRSAELGEDMYRVSTPMDGNLSPEVTDSGGQIQLRLNNVGGTGPAAVEVLLNAAVRWQLRLAGGGTEEHVDFRSGRLGGIELVGGASRIDIALPNPQGTLLVRLGAGAGSLSVNLRPGPPVQVKLTNGAGTLSVDDKSQTGLGAGTTVTPAGWQEATDRYDIEAVGGVSALIVHRH